MNGAYRQVDSAVETKSMTQAKSLKSTWRVLFVEIIVSCGLEAYLALSIFRAF